MDEVAALAAATAALTLKSAPPTPDERPAPPEFTAFEPASDPAEESASDPIPEPAQKPASPPPSLAPHSGTAIPASPASDVRAFETPDADLPPLPADDDSLSLLGDVPDEESALMEHDTRRRLMDMESSFIPESTPLALPGPTGADDTYLFGGTTAPEPIEEENVGGVDLEQNEEKRDHMESENHDNTGEATIDETPVLDTTDITQSPPTPSSAYKTPYATGHILTDESDMDISTSSPAAAAARRNLSRMRSVQSFASQGALDDSKDSIDGASSAETTNHGHARSVSQASTVKLTAPDDDAPTPTRSPAPDQNSRTSASSRLLKRPSFLQHRQASQRSSTSSFTNRSDAGSEITLGADYALQSGGAAPTSNSIRPSISLSRLPSLGSIASSLGSSYSESGHQLGRTRSSTSTTGIGTESTLGKLEEERASSVSPPATPRPGDSVSAAPTDTVIAQHVQNIRVPETVAREYREKHPNSPEARRTMGLSFSSRSKNNLTLKEQNSKIDKLSKENFDLKLKIHFLDQALQNRSDEGVKEMIGKSVQLQTDLANERKENQGLRRKVRELEQRLKEQEGAKGTSDEDSDHSEERAEMEEEIIFLRECVQQYEMEVEKLQSDNLAKEVDKRRLADYVKTMGETKPVPSTSLEETMEMWKDLLEAETARREQADEDAEKLREEIRRLKAEAASTVGSQLRSGYMSKRSTMSYGARSESDFSTNDTVNSRTSTLVEALKHENAELRRDLSAQTSMLTSRNRERERLQQEIEDLKLHQRRAHIHGAHEVRSVAGDSIFERSVSRAHNRAESRASGGTRATQMSDAERDDLEKKQAALRDELAQIKMTNQDLERELNAHLDILQNAETENRALKQERELAMEDLQALQSERDEALEALQERDEEIEELREEALKEIDELNKELDQREQDFAALQQEMKRVSESVVRLEDELNASRRKEQSLEQQLEEHERELEQLDKKLRDTVAKNERLDVQLESGQGEISFLREEQEADKIKIGELEAALSAAQSTIQDEKERMRELEERITEERRQRDVLDSQEKEALQKVLDDLNGQNNKSKDEVRKLKRALAAKETEASTWKERLEALEGSLLEALGDLTGTRSSILKDVTKLQSDLEHTLTSLDAARAELAEKERVLRNRDALLESAGLESRKLSELLEKERQARRQDRNHFDQMQRSQQSLTRTIQQNDTRAMELEQARNADRRKFSALEAQFREQLLERNNLLLALWNRLSTLCGADFMQKNSLVGDQLPSVDVIGRNLAAFSRNINLAVKTVEVLVGGFRARIRDVEKSLWKDFQTLEHAIDVRTKRIDHLEKMVTQAASRAAASANADAERDRRSASRSSSRSQSSELSKLKNENKLLKAELEFARNTSPTRPGTASSRAPHPDLQRSPSTNRDATRASMAATLLRHHSTSAVETGGGRRPASSASTPAPVPELESPTRRPASGIPVSTGVMQPNEQRWIHRLKELERRLKAEREARLLDRSGARKRLEEGRLENEELRMQLERERERRQSLEFDLQSSGRGEE
ncbi:hypothetical protein EJ06DRAFT_530544 [Trichodelitschia bisporula]|uniref:Anucleate primary sterigmata protein B n=1 Tax=Trichodelitschia bisporula TaxID=703511 RepID=A0A6G1HV88_9PEZI|nr:hypothetical protein EJ06DRAFT_530544 [Trichodelitschia bisporula]